MSYICIVNDKQDGCAADGGDERRLSELPFLAMFYTSMSGTRLHVYYRHLITNEGLSPEVTYARLRRGADTADSKIYNFYNNDKKKNGIYFFLIYSINVYIYTVSSVSKGVKRQCRMYVLPTGQTVVWPVRDRNEPGMVMKNSRMVTEYLSDIIPPP